MEKLRYEKMQSPVGELTMIESEDGLMRLDFETHHDILDTLLKTGQYVIAGSTLKNRDTIKQLKEYFDGKRKVFDIKLDIRGGSTFYRKVWNELKNIPFGEVRSYQEIAEAAGNKKASRAVGNANAHNPIAIIIPCHRVINADGGLGGFGGGPTVKKTLLAIEGHETYKDYRVS